jgi:hypothetical protein
MPDLRRTRGLHGQCLRGCYGPRLGHVRGSGEAFRRPMACCVRVESSENALRHGIFSNPGFELRNWRPISGFQRGAIRTAR